VAKYLRSNIALMKRMIAEGYQDAQTLKRRIKACEKWLRKPRLLRRDKKPNCAAEIEIDLAEITEPILACPNDPDDVKLLSEVAGDRIDEVFIGSCMTNISHFRAVGKIFQGAGYLATQVWLTPPTKMDSAQLMKEGYYSIFNSVGARMEIPGVLSAWGTRRGSVPRRRSFQRPPAISTTGWETGRASISGRPSWPRSPPSKGKLPTVDEYMAVMKERVAPASADIHRYLYSTKWAISRCITRAPIFNREELR